MNQTKIFATIGSIALVISIDAAAQTPSADPATNRKDYRDFAMTHEGSAARGRELFSNEQRAACVRCHSVDGTSSKAGPDLNSIGDKFPRVDLIHAVLEPSAEIAIGFGTTIVETKSGDTFQGIVKDATADALDLIGADGKRLHIATSDIKSQHTSPLSLMPEGLQTGLSRQEFTDVIDYLVTLQQPANALTFNRGMPAEIPALAKPVEVRPFLAEEMRFPHAFVEKPGDVRYGLTWFGQIPGFTNRFIVVHQPGTIWLIEKHETNDAKSLFADLTKDVFSKSGPNGLLGIAFHPKFGENHKYYLKHQILEGTRIVTAIFEREVSPDFRADSGKPSRLIWKATATTQDHTGGCITFGPDGFLYIGMGDTGPQEDPQGHGQNLSLPMGKMLRIDVDHFDPGLAYAIPSDNPFRSQTNALPEIWAYGLREPWRFSFDFTTGDLWVGDVGQDRVEEVSIVRRGENMGWNVFEGFEPFSNRYRKEGAIYTPPVFAYRRKYGNSITGGYVYRGDKNSSFYGVYVCGDYVSRRIFGIKQQDRVLTTARLIGTAPTGMGIVSFSQDEQGNLYLVGYEGMVYKLDFSNAVFEEKSVNSAAH